MVNRDCKDLLAAFAAHDAVHYLAKADLITNKRKVARPQGLEDVRALEREP